MPWFKMSDDWATHPKTISAGKDARSLWVITGNLMAKASTDGVIAKDQHALYAALAGVPWKKNAAKLVEVGFWHDVAGARACRDCSIDIDNINRHRRDNDLPVLVLGDGDLYWHAWAAHQLSKARQLSPEARAAEDRARALRRDTGLCQEIQKRDGSLCRYCGIRVDWRHRKGRHRATYDHLDPRCFTPNGGNYLEGVVTSCGQCNEAKGSRTVDEWVADGGHTLKPAGWRAGDDEQGPEAVAPVPPSTPPGSNPGSSRDLIQPPDFSNPGSDPGREHGRPHPGPGPGQVGLDPGPGSGQVGPGRLGLVGAGPGLGGAGLVRLGLGGDGSAEGAQQSQPTTEPELATAPVATTPDQLLQARDLHARGVLSDDELASIEEQYS